MEVGIFFPFQNPGRVRDDVDSIQTELKLLADPAERLGYDSLWFAEHHFTGYSMTPSPVQMMTYMAGRTSKIKLGSAVVVLPWHDPLRVTEEIAMLDILSNGRIRMALGRGAGRVEFDAFRVNMSESRERFVEAAQVVLQGLENGFCEFDGKYIKQPRVDIRPAPIKSFRGRSYVASFSPETLDIMADLGVGMMCLPQRPWEKVAEELKGYRANFVKRNGSEPPSPIVNAWVFCDENADRAHAMAHKYIGGYWQTVLDHYHFDTAHLQGTKGYEYYANYKKQMDTMGSEAFREAFVNLHVWGTPEMCFEKIAAIREKIGANTFFGTFSYALMPWEEVSRNFDLFTRAVKPELQRLSVVSGWMDEAA